MNADLFSVIDDDFDHWLQKLVDFLKVPSVSADDAYKGRVAECAATLAGILGEAGFEASVEETGGHPAVTAFRHSGENLPTVLIYGHYDVQPAKMEDGWKGDPFTPRIVDGALVARGATDDKGQLFCHVMAAAAHLKTAGKLPVNLKFIFEGEEEAGSANLGPFLLKNREKLKADLVLISDTAQYGPGLPALTYGLRGLLCMEVSALGPNRDLHSGSYGGAVTNPAKALSGIIAALVSENGGVAVEGFYDRVRELEAWERREWAELPFDEEAFAGELGVDGLSGEEGYTPLERMWARPTFEVNGLWSGYLGKGPKTIIPSGAGCKISFRLVPDQDPDEIARMVEKKLNALCPRGITLSVTRDHAARPVLLAREGREVEAAKKALYKAFGARPVMIREGGSIPVVETFSSLFSAPVILMGFGRQDDRAHGPEERFHLEDLRRGAKASAEFLSLLAGG